MPAGSSTPGSFARNAGEAFDLRCEVREKMLAYLQAEMPRALPRDRFDLSGART